MRRWAYVLAALLGTGSVAEARRSSEDGAGRRAIRGATVELDSESDELRALRAFEEESFPRSFGGVPTPAESVAEEGAAPDAPAARPTPDAPPLPLRSPDFGDPARARNATSPALSRGPAAPGATAVPWLAGLKLPDFPMRFDPHVVRYLEFYKSDKRGHAIMASWLRAQGRFRALIEDELRKARLPHALLYVAMIESGYDPHDRSGPGAVGVWQFMPEVARIYGLRIDHWVDERKDPERSTAAQMHYFADLKARFGSWHLALAAFNVGYGAVLRAMTKYNTNDYWELCRYEDGLPWETTLYVPKAIAAAIVGENRAAFGYGDVVPDAPFAYDRVPVRSSMSVHAIAQAAGVRDEEIAALNPELRRDRTPPGEPWDARVPRGTGPRFLASFERFREHLAAHVVRFGERLDDIARASGASGRELRRINGLVETAEMRPGMTLLVPEGRAPLPAPGDDEIALVAVPDRDLVVAGRSRVFYRVLPGDTVKDVASFFQAPVGELARWNHLDVDAALTPHMVLQVFVPDGFDRSRAALLDPARVRVVTVGSAEFFDLVEARRGRKRLAYKVRPGDTLKRIAQRFHLTEADLERINRFGRASELRVGQPVTVYVAMSAREKAEADRLWRVPPASPPPRSLATDDAAAATHATGHATGDDDAAAGAGATSASHAATGFASAPHAGTGITSAPPAGGSMTSAQLAAGGGQPAPHATTATTVVQSAARQDADPDADPDGDAAHEGDADPDADLAPPSRPQKLPPPPPPLPAP